MWNRGVLVALMNSLFWIYYCEQKICLKLYSGHIRRLHQFHRIVRVVTLNYGLSCAAYWSWILIKGGNCSSIVEYLTSTIFEVERVPDCLLYIIPSRLSSVIELFSSVPGISNYLFFFYLKALMKF